MANKIPIQKDAMRAKNQSSEFCPGQAGGMLHDPTP